jgi:hypothetical protein
MLDYYRTYGSFILLDSSNPQVNKKLTSICEKYKRQNENSFNELIEKNGHAQQENCQLIPRSQKLKNLLFEVIMLVDIINC